MLLTHTRPIRDTIPVPCCNRESTKDKVRKNNSLHFFRTSYFVLRPYTCPRKDYVQTSSELAVSPDALYRVGLGGERHVGRGDADRGQQRYGWLCRGNAQ